VAKSPDESSATQQPIADQSAAIAELVKTVETLKGQIRTLEEQPAEPKVFTHGAVPAGQPQPQLRGQDRGAPAAIGTPQALEMKKGLYGAADATEQNKIAQDMQALAIARLQEIHQGRPGQPG
jgi:hypothetical protein